MKRLFVSAAVFAFAAAAAQAQFSALETRQNASHGTYLTDAKGRALYAFSADRSKEEASKASACHDACATAWPPATITNTPEATEEVKPESLSSFVRDGGSRQATYGGWPLYYFAGDRGPGAATGHGVKQFGGTWHLVSVEGRLIDARRKAAAGAEGGASLFADLGLKSPECVRYDAQRGRYLVSNINGKMRQVDNNGFISVASADGATEEKWIAGGKDGVVLNAPKGMEINRGKLYVADIDHLRVFDIASGKPVTTIEVEGAKFLNDMAIADDGTVYITDTGTKKVPGAIYRIAPDRTVTTIAEGRDLSRPNGIDFSTEGDLVVATYASDQVMVLSTDGRIKKKTKLDAGKLDGLVVRSDGTILVSSWKGKHIVRLAPDGTAETVVTGLVQPAAFAVDEENGRLLVPQVKANKVAVSPLPSEEATSSTAQ